MFRLFPLVVVLQLFCLYHANKRAVDQKWYWLIIFFPVIGCLWYLYEYYYNREQLTSISEGIKSIVHTNYDVEKLELELTKTDSEKNKTALANKYLDVGRYDEAIELYESVLQANHTTHVTIIKSLVDAHYRNENYASAVDYAERITTHKEFTKSSEKVSYAWSLYHINEIEKAEQAFIDLDSRFTNYPHRMEYAKFINSLGRPDEAAAYLEELNDEFNQMQPQERKDKRRQLRALQALQQKFSKMHTQAS